MLIGKMDKDYTTYSADQLLNDDFFIQSELHPTEKSRAFWSDLQIKSAALSQEIENARLFLHTCLLYTSQIICAHVSYRTGQVRLFLRTVTDHDNFIQRFRIFQ